MNRKEGRLLYDSARTGSRLGTRTACDHPDRMLLFQAGGMCVDITIQPGPDHASFLYGQVVTEARGAPVCGATVWLGDDQSPECTDEYGEFALTSSCPETCREIRIVNNGTELICSIPAGCTVPHE